MNTIQFESVIPQIKQAARSVLTLHRSPDGDSIGSNLALATVLKQHGHTVSIYSKDPVPEFLQFLEGWEEIIVAPPEEIPFDQYDRYWALDMAVPEMAGGELSIPTDTETIVMDHHISNSGWGDQNIIDATSISTTSVLLHLFNTAGIELDSQIATYLLTGLATDSGFFQYCRDKQPFVDAAALVALGAPYQKIVIAVEKQRSEADLQYIGEGLARLTVDSTHRMCSIIIPHEIYEAHITDDESKSELITPYLSSVKGTSLGVLITEKEPGSFRLSFRSKDDQYSMSVLAAEFGGGGHTAAAGARVDNSTAEKILSQILKGLPKAKNGSSS